MIGKGATGKAVALTGASPPERGYTGTRAARAARVPRVRGTFGPCPAWVLRPWRTPRGTRRFDRVPDPSRQLVLRLQGVRGQTAAEYLGVLLVVSVIIAALATTDVGHDITSRLSELVQDIAGGTSGRGE